MADKEMDVATSPVNQTANKEETTTNYKSRTSKITTGQYLGKYESHTNMNTQIGCTGEAQIHQASGNITWKIKMPENQMTSSIHSRHNQTIVCPTYSMKV